MLREMPKGQKHARVYQACEPCRIKKVRCNLGTCYFTATRKRVVSGTDTEGFLFRNKRRAGSTAVVDPQRGERASSSCISDPNHRPTAEGDSRQERQETVLQNVAYTDEDTLGLLYRAGSAPETTGSPTIIGGGGKTQPIPTSSATQSSLDGEGVQQALQAWSEVRFVRDGLFSATEAMAYMQYFHDHLEPFTPVLSPNFTDPAAHRRLIHEEPILAVTILMLAARHCELPGAGSISRRYVIHDRLWSFLQGMIMRIFWAQDYRPRCKNGRASGFRTLGTCEALILLTEWHPRSLHFPPAHNETSIVDSDQTYKNAFTAQDPVFWLDWSWRSDRLCWSLLGTAMTLAFELGLFDDCDNTTLGAKETTNDHWRDPSFQSRAYRLQHVFWVFSTQMSGRLGWKYLAPFQLSEKSVVSFDDTSRLWTGIATLMRKGNELMFSSRRHTREIIQDGRYVGLLYIIHPNLVDWKKEFDRTRGQLTKQMRAMLAIEYDYVRVYLHSLATQAVVENKRTGQPALHRANEEFVAEVINGARCILECVLNDLLPDNSLKHIPVRAYSRILSAALFLMKTTSLNISPREDADVLLGLVERMGQAFKVCSVDDAHLGARWGTLLTSLILRQRESLRTATYGPGSWRAAQTSQAYPTPEQLSGAPMPPIDGSRDEHHPPMNAVDTLDWLPLPFPMDPMDGSFMEFGLDTGQMPWGGNEAGSYSILPFSGYQ
ncbi:hypothetical protein ASPZODRAFT_504515 [Penicilliopsis zonata CBS 506.65]|uniref:Transcription factor domain-containing protein n=1 Tax=Penicilliopsis zonata CBS 506.65 TaxID=1073090 RepID=A0A1L9SEY8_9EURO|nr:hypothetical protein ASPZODRAFT_504515 [Penicilliopsis zonata CBS 506.65]OJJ45657.1 hypothetical protein ASPZODRAFT_504515 [Penicilliopsis zonata CBS 506.65]